jgi:AGZA family xanthine/uracil permease-like MFS transporter
MDGVVDWREFRNRTARQTALASPAVRAAQCRQIDDLGGTMFDSIFKLSENKTTVGPSAGRDHHVPDHGLYHLRQPDILSKAGMPRDAVFAATCIAAAVGCMLMGVARQLPDRARARHGAERLFRLRRRSRHEVHMAGGAGLRVPVRVIFFILSVLPVREWIVNAIPKSLKMAIAAGIGLFLALIALQSAKIVVAHPATLVSAGDLNELAGDLAAWASC